MDKTRDANAALENFLKLTKHIVTDHAAFLFLTDRDYYEQLIAADNVDWGHILMTTPVATTFYSHRIFLSYEPKDYRKYLMEIVDQTSWSTKSEIERFRLELGLLAWGTILVYRARMVPFHFSRELKQLVDENGVFIERDPATPLMRSICRQQLTMQLGIEAIIRRDEVKERIHEVPVFQQYVYDTLYWPSYQHEKGLNDGIDDKSNVRPFILTQANLKKYLWFRAKGIDELPTRIFARGYCGSAV